MEYSVIVTKQVIIMFVLIAVGIIACRKNILSLNATRGLSDFILVIVSPCLLITAFNRKLNNEELKGLLLAFILSIIFHIIAIILGGILVKKRENSDYRVERMGCVYSNCGFMAFPLLSAILGDIGVFYGAVYVALFNIFLWSGGVVTLTSWNEMDKKKIILNPGMIGVILGLLLYFTQFKLPVLINTPITYLASLNTPLSMIMIGVFLARVDIKKMIKNINIYKISFIRLLLLPLILFVLIKGTGLVNIFNGAVESITAVLICCACPAAVSIILMVSKRNLNDEYGAEILAMSTLISIISLPLITMLATKL